MGYKALGLAACAALCLAAVPGLAQAGTFAPLSVPRATPPLVIAAAQEAPRFHHHGKRTQEVYCLRQNYWWFYRPYTTVQEDFPRCEPYFHYLEPAYGQRAAPPGPYFK